MGVTAAQKAMQILENVEYIVAIELLCAAQAVEFRARAQIYSKTITATSILNKRSLMERDKPSLTQSNFQKNFIS